MGSASSCTSHCKSHGQPSISMETPTIWFPSKFREPAPTKAKIKVGPGLGKPGRWGGGGGGGGD